MMMMMSIESVRNSLRASRDNYRKLSVLDATLTSGYLGNQTYDNDKATNEQAYTYSQTKLGSIIKQKKQAYDLMSTALEELKKTGTINVKTLQQTQTLEGKNNSGVIKNDDSAETVTKTNAELLTELGVKDLVDATDISAEQKKQLAGAYLTELEKIKNTVQDDSAIPTFDKNAATPEETAAKSLTGYAKLKEIYIAAVKKAEADGTIKLTDGAVDKAIYTDATPNKRFDPAYETTAGKGVAVSAENATKLAKLKEVKDKLDSTREQFKKAGIENIDELLDDKDFKPSQEAAEKLRKLNEDTEASKKFQSAFGGGSNNKDATWKPLAKTIYETLETQKKNNGGQVTTGITLENFNDKILNNGTIISTATEVYSAKGNGELPTVDSILNKDTSIVIDENGDAIKNVDKNGNETTNERKDIQLEMAGAAEANRENALKNIKPIAISTQRDQSPIDVGNVKVNGIPVQVTFEPGEEQVNRNSANSKELLISTFRGQPAVISKKDGKFYARFYDTQKAGNGYVLTTAIAEVDPKLVFKNKEFTQPKKELDYNMILPDKNKRRVVDYYVRAFNQQTNKDGTKGFYTDDDKVLYVARNFADTIDRLPAIRAAQYHARKLADPVAFKDKTTTTTAKTDSSQPISLADEPQAITVPTVTAVTRSNS
jgi:hypothetical protein